MRLRDFTIVVTLAMLFVPNALSGGPTRSEVEETQMSGIENFSQIEKTSSFAGSRIGFGGATQAVAMASLKSEGFKAVINLRLSGEENLDLQGNSEAARAAGLNYIHLPLDTSAPATDVVEKFLATLGNERNQPVYVHCGSATRAAALWMIGRVLVDGWDIDAASAEAELIAAKPSQAVAFATAYIASQRE
jgi:uncharacterized protein (TIGR01244 family)